MDLRFDNQVAVVTGAGSGIGFSCAELMAASGAKVAMVGRNGEKIKKAAQMLTDKGYDVRPYALDISDVDAIPGAVGNICSELGEIKYLIQCAGWMSGGSALELSVEDWDQMMNINARGTFFLMREIVRQSMIVAGGGAIVNISSMAGVRGMVPPMCSAHYSASKGAIVALTTQAAVEWGGHGIRANTIAPGGTMSFGVGVPKEEVGRKGPPPDMASPGYTPTGKGNTTEQIASAAVFLCHEASGNTTGQVLIIDGGSSSVGY